LKKNIVKQTVKSPKQTQYIIQTIQSKIYSNLNAAQLSHTNENVNKTHNAHHILQRIMLNNGVFENSF
jgi:hypothetical protein